MKILFYLIVTFSNGLVYSQIDSNLVYEKHSHQNNQVFIPNSSSIISGRRYLARLEQLFEINDPSDSTFKISDSTEYICKYIVSSSYKGIYGEPLTVTVLDSTKSLDSAIQFTNNSIENFVCGKSVRIQKFDNKITGSQLNGYDQDLLVDLNYDIPTQRVFFTINENLIIIRNINRRPGGMTYWVSESLEFYVKY